MNEATVITQNRHENTKVDGGLIHFVPLYEWLIS